MYNLQLLCLLICINLLKPTFTVAASPDSAACELRIVGDPEQPRLGNASVSCRKGYVELAINEPLLGRWRSSFSKALNVAAAGKQHCSSKTCLITVCNGTLLLRGSISGVQDPRLHTGGMICAIHKSHVTMVDFTLSNNDGSGVLASNDSTIAVINSTITDHIADGGAGVLALNNSRVYINSTVIANCTTDGWFGGGGLVGANRAQVIIHDSVIKDNVASNYYAGGGLATVDDTNVTMINTTISNNTAGEWC